MKRLVSLDCLTHYDNAMDRFEELIRHYDFEKALEKLEEEDTFNDWQYFDYYNFK